MKKKNEQQQQQDQKRKAASYDRYQEVQEDRFWKDRLKGSGKRTYQCNNIIIQ